MELLTLKLKLFPKYLRKEVLFKLNRWTASSFIIGLLIFFPIAMVAFSISSFSSNWDHITETVLMTYSMNTIALVSGTIFFAALFGVSSAWVVASYKFPGHRMFKWLLVLPLSIPTYIAAYAYFDILDVLNPLLIWIRSTIGFEAMQSTNNLLVYLLTALVMSSVLYPYVYL